MAEPNKFIILTRLRDGVTFLANINHIQRIINDADTGCHICWSNEDEMTQVNENILSIQAAIIQATGGLIVPENFKEKSQ